MNDEQYSPICFSVLDAADIEEGQCPECGADLAELSDFPPPDDQSSPSGEEEDYWDDVEKAIIATLFFMDE